MCKSKNVKIPPSILLNLETGESTLNFTNEMILNQDEKETQLLLYCIATYIKTNPKNIKELNICSINIPENLINAYCKAFKVLL